MPEIAVDLTSEEVIDLIEARILNAISEFKLDVEHWRVDYNHISLDNVDDAITLLEEARTMMLSLGARNEK